VSALYIKGPDRPTICSGVGGHYESKYIYSINSEQDYIGVYKAPRALYTLKKQTFIYFVVRVLIGVKVKT